MRSITKNGLNLIKHFEKFSGKLYVCPGGYTTVGFGHLVNKNELDYFKNGIDETQALNLLARDVRIAETSVLKMTNVPLTDGQFDALVSFVFNLGSGAFQRSTLRRKVNREEHDEVPDEFLKWVYAGGKKLKGLILRRKAESMMYQSNIFQLNH